VDVIGDDGSRESFPEYVFRPVRARLQGIELEGRRRLIEGPWTLDLSGKLDLTRARNSDTGAPLPRVAPLRVAIGLDAVTGPWSVRAEMEHSARQTRVPTADLATDAYTLLNLALTRRLELGAAEALWFVKLSNALDALAYNAATIRTVRELAPMPGRALKTGLRVAF
jgi:iron complex outermembrane receptor protein